MQSIRDAHAVMQLAPCDTPMPPGASSDCAPLTRHERARYTAVSDLILAGVVGALVAPTLGSTAVASLLMPQPALSVREVHFQAYALAYPAHLFFAALAGVTTGITAARAERRPCRVMVLAADHPLWRVGTVACLMGAVGSAGSVALTGLVMEPQHASAAVPCLITAVGFLGAAVGAAQAMRPWMLKPQVACAGPS